MSPDVPEVGHHGIVLGTEAHRTAFPVLAGAVFVIATGYGVVLPLLPVLLRRWMGEPDAALAAWHTGALTGIYMLALAAAAPRKFQSGWQALGPGARTRGLRRSARAAGVRPVDG